MNNFINNLLSNVAPQAMNKEDHVAQLIRKSVSGTDPQLDPIFLYEIKNLCNNQENTNKVIHSLTHVLDDVIEHPLAVFKSLILVTTLLKMIPGTVLPAMRNYIPEVQTITNVSFDKPGIKSVNLIHKYANGLYLHLMGRGPLPDVKVPPPPQRKPSHHPGHGQRSGHQVPHGAQQMNNDDGGSLFGNDNDDHYEEPGNFLSNFIDLGEPKKHPKPQQHHQMQQPKSSFDSKTANLPESERPRIPAVFAAAFY